MESDRRDAEGVREFRLEGGGLALVGAVLVVALVGAFMVGRWYERGTQPQVSGAGGADPLGNVVEAEEPADLDESSNYFDSLEGDGKQAEPDREAVDAPSRGEAEQARGAPAEASGGPFYVQVFAGRDRRAAESLVGQLQAAQFPVRLFSERSGQDALFKVRVGGYGTDEEARSAAKTLVQQGYGGAWVTRVE